MKIKYFIVLSLIFFSCNNNSLIEINKLNESNDSIEIYYMRPYVKTSFSYTCDMINEEALKKDINYKVFNDSNTINKFLKIYNNYVLESSQEEKINARIRILINVGTNKDTLCLGENHDTFINGIKFKDNAEMLSFIKEIIDYENTPRPNFPKKDN